MIAGFSGDVIDTSIRAKFLDEVAFDVALPVFVTLIWIL